MPPYPFSNHPVRVEPYFGYRSQTTLHVSGRALRSAKAKFAAGGRRQAMRTMISQFVSHEVPGLPVTLQLTCPKGAAHSHLATTDAEGFVRFEIELDDWRFPPAPTWEAVSLHWNDGASSQSVNGHVLAPGEGTQLGVISDIDDTIIETGITGNVRAILRNWKRVLAQMPEERAQVPDADIFYNALGGNAPPMPGLRRSSDEHPAPTDRPFFYVSSSPWNLYSYLVAYKKVRGLPLGPIALRDWGLNRETFGSGSHGAHKRRAIEKILATYPAMQFALIGDDTQGDLTAFNGIVTDYPDRIAAIFIRTAGEQFSPEEALAKANIEASEVPLWLGPDFSTGEEFLNATGLDKDSDATHIVETIESKLKAD
ncbi:App1 family protein [Pontixanthobacter gangjinensis]|uniref:DUF2183 domain-containing protein n=1 Tax=Pontixanthobacter gangjinensis TaxID=1028742 RepID=A0A6I4SLT1_9SPHN|nr:phosphatase domain-containing protein [Pontixanthobacter gangjinensis]MXO55777.1 DUF2183 domain-containing protein [Pontixanthobacter gangjinensis]